MKIFSQGESKTPMLRSLQQEKDAQNSWEGDLNSTIKLLFTERVALRSMEIMKLEDYPELIATWNVKPPEWSFANLKYLIVENRNSLSYVIPSHLLYLMRNLEELEICSCDSLEAVFDLKETEEPHKLAPLRLKSMKLCRLPKLKCVWNKEPQRTDFCQHLGEVNASKCGSLRSIFTATIAKHLPKLEVLNVEYCSGVELIVEKNEIAEAAPCFVFPQLRSLRLVALLNLRNFYPYKHKSEWPLLRELTICCCNNLNAFGSKVSSTKDQKYPLCLIEKVIPRLKILSLNQKAITKIKNGQFQDDLFCNVEALWLESFLDENVTFPYDFLQRFPNIQELHIYASFFEEIFPRQLPIDAHTEKIPQFKNLKLVYLTKLKNIWNEDLQLGQVLQDLESLYVDYCPALIALAPSSASFDNLTDLEVSECHKLIYLITSSTAKSLVNLLRLKINDCKMMEEIVTNKEENEENTFAVQKLECLELTGLSNLKAFCSFKNYAWIFPSLYQVFIRKCPRLSMFCTGDLDTPILKGVEVEENGLCWDENLNKTIHNIFTEKVALCSMEKIKFVEYPELIDIWKGKFSNWTFSNLKSLIVENCNFLFYAIPSHLLNSLVNLEELSVVDCNSLEAVFDLQNMKGPHKLPQLRLKRVFLWRLPKLKSIWNKDPQQINFCQHLQKVRIAGCDGLRSIFPASIAKCLFKLEELMIFGCARAEVIVEKDVVARVAPCFEFPLLHTLELWKLPNLKNFYPATHTSEWPQLRVLKVYMCENMKLFVSEIPNTTETHEKDELEARHPLFFVEKVIPNLEALVLNQKTVMMIRNTQLQVDLFHKVKLLYLESFNDEPATISYSFLEGFANLNELHVYNSSFVEIFPSQRTTGNNFGEYAPHKILHLDYLEQLKNTRHSDSQLGHVFQNLEGLKVQYCSRLINLAPSSASFDCLKKLEVYACPKLTYLVTSSTAMSLVHLTTLKVRNFKMIEEIVTIKKENVGNTIAMPKLECLELSGLSSLKAFCSAKMYCWDFSSLCKVIIRECPRLSMFCTGAFTAPTLMGVEIEEKTTRWNDNLHKTIEQLYVEKVALHRMEKIELGEYPELIDIWKGKFSSWTFGNLKSLIVKNCEVLSYVIPSYLLKSIGNLEELKVGNCNSVEAVFDLQDIKEPHTLPQLRLKSITLWHLPKLKSVWNKGPQQVDFCQHLEKVIAVECDSLRSVFPAPVVKYLSELQELRIVGCVRVEVIVEKDEITRVAPCFEFPQLHTLQLWKLPNLRNFYPERHTSEWPQLRVLKVYLCENVEVFGLEIPCTTDIHEKDELEAPNPIFFVEKVVPNLEELVLSQKSVTMIRNNQFEVDLFQKVKLLYLESFKDEPVTFPFTFLERFSNLNELHVSRSSFEEIFPSRGAIGNNLEKYPPFKILELAHLEQLKNIWHSDSQLELVLQNLESLKVESCSSLVNLVPSSASFGSLRKLDVSGSHQLIYLVTSSAARSLVHLTTLKVNDCKMIEEIIAKEGANEEKEVLLKELECLELTDLPSLKSFCSRDCKFRFPSLTKVAVRGCPNMKKFCSGLLATPLLRGVRVEESKKLWEGDLNKTMQQLFFKKDGQNSSEG